MHVDVLSAVLRALALVAVFQAAGGSIALGVFHRHLTAVAAALRRLVTLSALGGMGLLTLQYLLEAGRMAGELGGVLDPKLQSLTLHSTLAVALVCRLIGLAVLVAGVRLPGRAGWALGGLGALGVSIAFTLTGHTSIANPRGLVGLALLLHVLLVAFWIGILPPLYMQTRRDPAAARQLTEAFSKLAIWLVPLIPLLGIGLAFGLMDSTVAWVSPYGVLLFGKLAGFILLMVFAALNKLRFGPALSAGRPTAAKWLRISVGAEYALIVAVLALTAVLTTFLSPEG